MSRSGSGFFAGSGREGVRKEDDHMHASSQDRNKGNKKSLSVVPVTLKQLSMVLQENSGETMINGMETGQVCRVTFVGLILSCNDDPNAQAYVMDDSTAQVIVRTYTKTDENLHLQARRAQLRENMYARVYANISNHQGSKSIIAAELIPITDHNEIMHANLEAMKYYLLSKKPASYMNSSKSSSNNMHGISDHSMGSDINNCVNEYIKRKSIGDEGVWVVDIARELSQYSRVQIDAALRQLGNDGQLYCTIDDDHYKSTN